MADLLNGHGVATGLYAEAARVAITTCPICLEVNPKGKTHPTPLGWVGGWQWASYPFRYLQTDFAELHPTKGNKYYLFVITHQLKK